MAATPPYTLHATVSFPAAFFFAITPPPALVHEIPATDARVSSKLFTISFERPRPALFPDIHFNYFILFLVC